MGKAVKMGGGGIAYNKIKSDVLVNYYGDAVKIKSGDYLSYNNNEIGSSYSFTNNYVISSPIFLTKTKCMFLSFYDVDYSINIGLIERNESTGAFNTPIFLRQSGSNYKSITLLKLSDTRLLFAELTGSSMIVKIIGINSKTNEMTVINNSSITLPNKNAEGGHVWLTKLDDNKIVAAVWQSSISSAQAGGILVNILTVTDSSVIATSFLKISSDEYRDYLELKLIVADNHSFVVFHNSVGGGGTFGKHHFSVANDDSITQSEITRYWTSTSNFAALKINDKQLMLLYTNYINNSKNFHVELTPMAGNYSKPIYWDYTTHSVEILLYYAVIGIDGIVNAFCKSSNADETFAFCTNGNTIISNKSDIRLEKPTSGLMSKMILSEDSWYNFIYLEGTNTLHNRCRVCTKGLSPIIGIARATTDKKGTIKAEIFKR